MSNGGTLNGVSYSAKNGLSVVDVSAGVSDVLEHELNINPITKSIRIRIFSLRYLLYQCNNNIKTEFRG